MDRVLVSFSAVTNFCKLNALKQHRLIMFWRSEVSNGSAGLCSFRRVREGCACLPSPAPRGCLHSLACVLFLLSPTAASMVTSSSLTLILLPLSYKNSCDYIGPTWVTWGIIYKLGELSSWAFYCALTRNTSEELNTEMQFIDENFSQKMLLISCTTCTRGIQYGTCL